MDVATIIASFLSILVAICAFFLARLIRKNDELHEKTRSALAELSTKVERLSYDNQALRGIIKGKLDEFSGLHNEEKAKISEIFSQFQEIQKEISQVIIPKIHRLSLLEEKVGWIEKTKFGQTGDPQKL